MKSKIYKIKHKQNGEYWTGYSSVFTSKGKEFASFNQAAQFYAARALRYCYDAKEIKRRTAEVEIVEFEVVCQETTSTPASNALIKYQFCEQLRRKHGRTFASNYSKFSQDPNTAGKYKVAIKVKASKYEDFIKQLKDLGYNSRNFKKTKEWLWIDDEAVIITTQLMDHHSEVINLITLEKELNSSLI